MACPFQIKSYEQYKEAYKKSSENPEQFWEEVANTFTWQKKWDKALEWNFKEPNVKWFIGGKLNITENCIDRHLADKGDTPVIIWEPNNPNEATRTLTYKELHFKVNQFA